MAGSESRFSRDWIVGVFGTSSSSNVCTWRLNLLVASELCGEGEDGVGDAGEDDGAGRRGGNRRDRRTFLAVHTRAQASQALHLGAKGAGTGSERTNAGATLDLRQNHYGDGEVSLLGNLSEPE